MKSIFFDLETTGLNPCAQILNYSFMTVNENWEITSEHNGSIHISRLQLPNPYAILANRVDVIDHQKQNYPKEPEAMVSIRQYIQKEIDTSRGPINLVGFNSNRFDVPFLRTSMIRNGVNPYFGQSIIYKDVLHAAQKLALSNPEFLDKVDTGEVNEDGSRKFSLRLAHLSKIFFGEKQLHESSDDVRLTIQLAKMLAEDYNLDIRTWDSFEAQEFCKPGTVLVKEFPAFDARHHRDDTDKFARETLICYEDGRNYTLWISLERMKDFRDKLEAEPDYEFGRDEIKNCVLWFNKRASSFYVAPDLPTLSDEDSELAKQAREIVKEWDIKLSNFWPPKNCDIEAFIYDLSFDGMDALADAIQGNDLKYLTRLDEEAANTLYERHFINNCKEISMLVRDRLNKYALYRYGSRMKVDKTDTKSVFNEDDPIMNPAFHDSYNELVEIIEDKLNSKNPEDVKLMKSLKQFYEESPMSTDEVKAFNRIPF